MFGLKSSKQLIYAMLVFVLIIVAILITFNYQNQERIINLKNYSWEYSLTEASVSELRADKTSWQPYQLGEYLPAETKKLDYVWLRTKLPKFDFKAPVLHFRGADIIYFPYQVYIGQDLFFTNGKMSGELKVPEYSHEIKGLPHDAAGQYLYIKIYNKGNKLFVANDLLNFRKDYQTELKGILFKNTLRLIATVLYLLIGVFILIVYWFKKDESSLLYLGLFLCSAFIFTLYYNVIPHLLFSQFSYELYILYYFNVFFIVGVFFLYLAELIWEKAKLFNKIGSFYLVSLLAAVFAYFIKPNSILLGSKIYNICLLFVLLVTIYYVAKISLVKDSCEGEEFKHKRDKAEVKILGLGFIGLGINAGISLIYAFASEYQFLNFMRPILSQVPLNKSDFVLLGIFYLVIVLLYITVRRFFVMQELALQDSLTGLYNHGYFQEVLKQEVRQAERYGDELSLLIFDLDDFKEVNDTYGHQAGDYILRRLAKLLEDHTRKSDIVARYGGEEFAVILINTDLDNAVGKGKELKDIVAGMDLEYEGEEICITTSVGAANYAQGDSAAELITKADNELYYAKTSGKDQISY